MGTEGDRPGASASAADADWLSYPEALEAILERTRPLERETLPAREALGRAVAEEVRSEVEHPPWDASAMDGFAVRADDVEGAEPSAPVTLPISGDVPAGSFPAGPLRPGTAVRVTTGAPVPEGATGVIRVEHTDGGDGGSVTVHRRSDAERNIRRSGEDVERGDVLLRPGEEVTPAAVGVLAMTGRREVETIRSPRVGVLATGDELAELEEMEEARAGRKVMNSNSHALAAQVRSAGGRPTLLGIARDDPDELRRLLEEARDLDAVVSTGGVSVGRHDHVKEVLEDLGVERLFWRAKIRPGSPIFFGTLEGGGSFWGLPGNPVSAMVTFEVFLRPALRALGGHSATRRRRLRVRLGEDVSSRKELTYFYRATLSSGDGRLPVAELTGPQGSGILTSMTAADALLIVPEGVERVEAGTEADAIPLRGWTA